MELIGPFTQILPLTNLPIRGALKDEQLQIIPKGGILVNEGYVVAVGHFDQLYREYSEVTIKEIEGSQVLLPGFIDCHTHICYGGDRSKDYALRIAGKSYMEISKAGGGIWDSVTQTRTASKTSLVETLVQRANRHLAEGVTTIEVKSGYGLDIANELKQLRSIAAAQYLTAADLIPTCLAAHLKPKDFEGDEETYLAHVLNELLPVLQEEQLAKRVDIFIEENAFSVEQACRYLDAAKKMGFDLTVHADQFSIGGSRVAVELGALSADHLEASQFNEINFLAQSETVAVALPGASLGLGMSYTPARKLLDAGACLAIGSDWNPGSAPMGDLLMQAAALGASEKLSTAETFAALTSRAAKALGLYDRACLDEGFLADMQGYPVHDYREILYYQGKLKPDKVWKNGFSI